MITLTTTERDRDRIHSITHGSFVDLYAAAQFAERYVEVSTVVCGLGVVEVTFESEEKS